MPKEKGLIPPPVSGFVMEGDAVVLLPNENGFTDSVLVSVNEFDPADAAPPKEKGLIVFAAATAGDDVGMGNFVAGEVEASLLGVEDFFLGGYFSVISAKCLS